MYCSSIIYSKLLSSWLSYSERNFRQMWCFYVWLLCRAYCGRWINGCGSWLLPRAHELWRSFCLLEACALMQKLIRMLCALYKSRNYYYYFLNFFIIISSYYHYARKILYAHKCSSCNAYNTYWSQFLPVTGSKRWLFQNVFLFSTGYRTDSVSHDCINVC